MHILIISHAAGTPDIGPNMRTYYLGRKLVSFGHTVTIVGSGHFHKYSNSPLVSGRVDEHSNIDGINYHWLATKSYSKRGIPQVLNQLSFVQRLRKVRSKLVALKPDLVIMSSPPPFGIYSAHYVSHKAGAKLIFEIRDLWPEIIEDLGNLKKSHPYIKLVRNAVHFAYRKADGIVSVKPGDLDYIRGTYNPTGKLAYIPNGFDHLDVLEEEYSNPILQKPGFKLVYTGALSNYYAIGALLEALKILNNKGKNMDLLIAGDGDDRQLYEAFKNQNELDNVYFLGFLPKKYMVSLIKQCDVAFLGLKDTRANQLGISTNKLYEYMYAQRPIIASYNTEHDIVNLSECGLSVEPESPKAIANAIEKFLKMSSKDRLDMGRRGYHYLLRHHTFEKITEDYLNFFESLQK